MLLNALTHYLQHQPAAPKLEDASQTHAVASDLPADKASQPSDAYVLSSRALMVSAVAHEFDVQNLERTDVGKLQQRLQHFGLLNGRALEAFSLLHAKQEPKAIDAVELYQQAASDQDHPMSFSHKQGVKQMLTLMSNLASARHS